MLVDIEDLAPPPVFSSLREVVESGGCSACGLCESILGARMTQGTNDRLRPALPDDLNAEQEARVLRVCPGTNVGGPEMHDEAQSHPFVGPWLSVRKGHALDPEVRHRAAAGGGLTSLGLHLLESRKVDCIMHVSPNRLPTKDFRGRLSFNAASVLEGAGSRYAPSAPLADLESVLSAGRPFALIGKPCDVNAVCNLAEVDPRVNQLCKFKLTISCGQFPDPSSYHRIMEQQGIAPEQVAEFRYRGHGCPGWSPFIKTTDGREGTTDYVDFWYGAVPHSYQWRCKMCPDFLGYQADVTVMDAWPGGPPEHHERITEGRRHEHDGWVLAVARTPAGEILLDAAQAAGAFTSTASGVQEVLDTQPHQLTKAVGLWSRRLAHRDLGQPIATLSPSRDALMRAAAFDPALIAAATSGSGVTVGMALAAADGGTGQVSGAGEGGADPTSSLAEKARILGVDVAKVGPAFVEFHHNNYEGCVKRIQRGDPKEMAPLQTELRLSANSSQGCGSAAFPRCVKTATP